MKNWSKWLGALLTCVLALTLLFSLPATAEAATYGDLTYSVSNGEVTITDCSESATGDLVIPDTIEGYPVTSIGTWAFGGCASLTSITIPDSVTAIGHASFNTCKGLLSITIPGTVDSIGDSAFSGCTGLVDVVINEGVTVIGRNAFQGCTSLSSIVIPDSVTTIGNSAFSGCTGLKSVTIGEGVTTIGRFAFSGCSGLEEIYYNAVAAVVDSSETFDYAGKDGDGIKVTIGAKVQKIPAGFVGGETNITTVEFEVGSTCTSIGSAAFSGCTGLSSITIPDSVIDIGDSAFSGCTGLTSVSIGDNVTTIGKQAFYRCTALSSVTGGKSVNVVEDNAFYPTAWLDDSQNQLDGLLYLGSVAIAYIGTCPAEVTLAEGTTQIYSSAFSGCSTLTSIIIPNSVTSIGGSAFFNCSSLTDIAIPNGVTTIADNTFRGCKNLSSITIPDSVTSIGEYAFEGCSSLTDINIPDGVTRIGDLTFSGCTNLSSITIPDSVTSIGTEAFYDCRNLTAITIPASVVNIETEAFTLCSAVICVDEQNPVYCSDDRGVLYNKDKTSLICAPYAISGSYTIPDSVVSVNGYAFIYCDLTSISIPVSVTQIGSYAFYSCGELAEVYYAGDLYSWLNISFSQYGNPVNSKLYLDGTLLSGEVVIPDGTEEIGNYALSGCDDITGIVIPDSVTVIGYSAFSGCSNLRKVIIGDGVTKIGESAFNSCYNLRSAVIPGSVTTVDRYAFRYCTNMSVVLYKGTEEQWNSITIKYENGKLTSATRHYVVETACVHDYLYCADCDSSFDFSGALIPAYTVQFINWDGSVHSSAKYHQGDIVAEPETPTKAADNTYTYTFTGWDREVAICSGEAVYTATYTPVYIDYTVTFKNWDGTVLSEKTYHYGDTVEIPTAPTKAADNTYTYAFNSWDQEIIACAGDTVYTATYTPTYIEYTVIFKDWDSTVLSEKTYHYGDTVEIPADPTRGADNTYTYVFNSWDQEVTACAGDTVYTATYTPTYIEYTVTFKNWDGTVLSEKTYHYGDTVEIPADPTRGADNTYTYVFNSWDQEVTACAGDAIYTATYTPTYIDYTVTFKDWDGTVLSEKTYHYGDTVTAPETPTKVADDTYTYAFAAWDKELVCVGNDVITATYIPTYIDYTVTFKNWDGTVLSEKTYHYGDTVEIPTAPTKAADNTYTYAFAGWDKEVVACAGNITYTATYTPTYIDYTVTFKDWDGFTIEKKTYHYGDTVTAPADPVKAGDRVYTYTFTGWDPQVTVCAADAVYTATYSREMIDYVVTFQNADGTVISQKTYHYGDSVEIPTDFSAPEGYKFVSWDKEVVTTVDGNAVYTAICELDWLKGDFDSSGSVDDADALYLLRHTLFADRYPIPGDGDVDGNGSMDDADALYLLRYTLFSDRYPLYPKKEN